MSDDQDGLPACRPVPFGQTQASVLLDLLRGLAAVLVLVDHWRNMLFVDYPLLQQPHWILAAVPYLLTSAGHQAVVVFFVLSGFLVGGSVLRAMERQTFRWGDYLLHRLVRLWIVLVPGLLLCLLWDGVGLHLGRTPLLYGGANFNHLTPAVAPRLSLRGFFGNLFFLGGLRVPTFGSDGALWSLAYEFWYYLLFPLGCLLIRRQSSWRTRVEAGAVLALCAVVSGPHALFAFPIWLLGALLARMPKMRLEPTLQRCVLVGYPILFFATCKLHLGSGLGEDYLLGLATGALLLVLLGRTQAANPLHRGVRGVRLLARGSFTLYVMHLPLMLLVTSLVVGDGRWQPNGTTLCLGLAVLVFTTLYSYGLAAVTEFHTEQVRQSVEALFARGRRWFTEGIPGHHWKQGVSAAVHDTVQ